MRLNRFLSLCGLGSRRGVESLITEGHVSINGSFSRSLGTQVNEGDEVKVNGRVVRAQKGIVIAMHKPPGYLCSKGDTHSRSTIYDLLPVKFEALHHVGRLDKESEGLLLMTNRGDLSQRLLHPSEGVEKEYDVVVDKPLNQAICAKLVKGMQTEEGFAKAERAFMSGNSDYRVSIVLKQGLKRQIRHMLYGLGFEVERLVRVRIGWLLLKGISKGGYRELTETEIERFFTREKGGTVRVKKRVRPASKKMTPEGEAPKPIKTAVARKAAIQRLEGKKKAQSKLDSRETPRRKTNDSSYEERGSAGRKPAGRKPTGSKSEDRDTPNRRTFGATGRRTKSLGEDAGPPRSRKPSESRTGGGKPMGGKPLGRKPTGGKRPSSGDRGR